MLKFVSDTQNFLLGIILAMFWYSSKRRTFMGMQITYLVLTLLTVTKFVDIVTVCSTSLQLKSQLTFFVTVYNFEQVKVDFVPVWQP